jgi:hypothetical protein
MKIDPSIHIGMHLVCFSKTGCDSSSSSAVSDRYNNLKAAWDSLMEATEHASPQGFHVAVTVVLERLKREELKRKSAEPKK